MNKKEKILNKITSLAKQGQLAEAYKILKKNSKKITDEELWLRLGAICSSNGLSAYCMECCKRAIQLNGMSAHAYSYLGKSYIELGDRNNAVAATGRAVEFIGNNGKDSVVEFNCGFVLRALERYDVALTHFLSSLMLDPHNATTMGMIGSCYQAMGDVKSAIFYFKKSLSHNPDVLDSLVGLGSYYLGVGDFKRAENYYNRALIVSPGLPVLLDYRLNILVMLGKKKEAYELLRQLIDARRESAYSLSSYASLCSSYGSESEFIKLAENHLARTNINNTDKRMLGYALGNVYDKTSRYAEAFEKYQMANAVFYRKYDINSHIDYTNKTIEYYQNVDNSKKQFSDNKDTRLIFIVGMPRSGTSLVEQILSSHSSVFAAGELSYLNDVMMAAADKNGFDKDWVRCMTSATPNDLKELANQYLTKVNDLTKGEKIVTDKMPTNYVYVGLIRQLFPTAKILHCKRDPRDTCLSIHFQNFGARHSYSCDLNDTARVYMDYDRLMKHYISQGIEMYDVFYEDLIADFETCARNMLSYCNLEWESDCLEFYKSKRHVVTASFDQVNKPIYKNSLARWKNYEKHLSEIEEILKPVL